MGRHTSLNTKKVYVKLMLGIFFYKYYCKFFAAHLLVIILSSLVGYKLYLIREVRSQKYSMGVGAKLGLSVTAPFIFYCSLIPSLHWTDSVLLSKLTCNGMLV